MRVGPMPLVSADKLMRVFQSKGLEVELETAGEPLDESEQGDADATRTESPSNLYFVSFHDGYLETVREDLVRLGLMHNEDLVSTGTELDGEDWLCPKCGKMFEAPGECPVHKKPLVTFEVYAALPKSGEAKSSSPVFGVLVFIGIIIYLYVTGKIRF